MVSTRRGTAAAVAAGIVAGLCAATGTWFSLDSITIDDGLEGLIVLPILAAACAVPGAWLGYRQARRRDPIACGVAAAATVTAALLIWQGARDRGGPPVLQNLGLGGFILLPVAMLGVLFGFGAGWITFDLRRTRREPTSPTI